MPRKALTFRADDHVAVALTNLGHVLGRPVNQLLTDAVTTYLDRRMREAERDLETRLASLRAYRQHDPDFEKAIEAFAEAEAGFEDPVEGTGAGGRKPIRRQIRRLLNG